MRLLQCLLCLLLPSSLLVLANFEYAHNDYSPSPVPFDDGWGVTKCIDFQEVSTLFRPVTFEPALVVTCELKTHQCVTIRAVNGTHYYTFQGCLPQARASSICTDLAYESALKNGVEYFYCYDVTYDRLNVPRNVPLFGRECCCNGDFCNRIENVVTIPSIVPHDEIISPYGRILHSWYFNLVTRVGQISLCATIIFWCNIIYIIFKTNRSDDDSGWYAAPTARNQQTDDAEDEMDDENDADVGNEDDGGTTIGLSGSREKVAAAAAAAAAAPAAAEEAIPAGGVKPDDETDTLKRRARKKKAVGVNETPELDKTQDASVDDNLDKTGDDERKEDKKTTTTTKESAEKQRESVKEATSVPESATKGTQEEPKKEEEPKMFTLPKQPKKLANGRIQYVSMFNENSDYDDED